MVESIDHNLTRNYKTQTWDGRVNSVIEDLSDQAYVAWTRRGSAWLIISLVRNSSFVKWYFFLFIVLTISLSEKDINPYIFSACWTSRPHSIENTELKSGDELYRRGEPWEEISSLHCVIGKKIVLLIRPLQILLCFYR